MENTINHNTTHVDYTPYQLRLPIDLSLVIDKLDPMWSFLEIVNSINLRRFIRSHKEYPEMQDMEAMTTTCTV